MIATRNDYYFETGAKLRNFVNFYCKFVCIVQVPWHSGIDMFARCQIWRLASLAKYAEGLDGMSQTLGFSRDVFYSLALLHEKERNNL